MGGNYHEKSLIQSPELYKGFCYLPVIGPRMVAPRSGILYHGPMNTGVFDNLSPQMVLQAVEKLFAKVPESSIQPFSSYVNRVYGLGNSDEQWVVKFYRPGRWSHSAIETEHAFMADCARAELPVVAPLPGVNGQTLQTLALDDGSRFHCALFPKRAGRLFDGEGDEDWFRLGSLLGRLHLVGKQAGAPERAVCHPLEHGAAMLQELYDSGSVHPDLEDEFFDLAENVLERIAPDFDHVPFIRIHGDCHRGNILDRGPEGLLLIDFDDMMSGPAVQDLWLLLPDRLEACGRELTMILDGYGQFMPFDRAELELVEGLRFMRMVHYLAWCARQRLDHRFLSSFPDWGSKAFWIKELEDFRTQAHYTGI